MPLDYKTANHTCNVVRRHIQAAFPDLTLFYIVHAENERKKSFTREASKISEHPAGEDILNFFKANPSDLLQNRSRFIGLSEFSSHGFLGFFRKQATAAVIFINHDRFSSEDNLRNHALHLAWHAIALLEDSKSDDKNGAYKIEHHFITPDLDENALRHRNLLADIFSATFQILQGRNDAALQLATQRMKNTLIPEVGFIAENFPFPISIDTLEFILKEQLDQSSAAKKQKNVSQSLKITKEVGDTYKPSSIQQWESFSLPAQEMAWCGFPPEAILGCAIYSSENTYIRSIADMVAERLSVKPEIISTNTDYNTFAENEANERLHGKKIQEKFLSVLGKIHVPEDHKFFLKEAQQQNERILHGNPIGWSAHGFIAVSKLIENTPADQFPDQIRKKAAELFNLVIADTSFRMLQDFAKDIFTQRRDGALVDSSTLHTMQETTEAYREIVSAIEYIKSIETQLMNIKDRGRNISSFVSPNVLKS